MSELLSPAGTIESFYAAISSSADAIYLGLDKFSARAYANNFTIESLKELVKFAHLRNVKIFITINTIIYDDELDEVYKSIDELANMGVDAIIIQDLAVNNYIVNHYSSLASHASTQMGVDDLDAANLLKNLGFKRIVFARETPIKRIKEIKNKLNIEVEAFIHGALCVSYSGNCYMSSMIGERSGNRGRCAGCCRKYYSLIDLDNNNKIKEGYLLSMKDLNTLPNLKDMLFIDSLKIEGRMKEPVYVAAVTNTYRKALDNESINNNILDKVFNRTYTLGFMNNMDSSNITNYERPNNYGYLIGTVIKQYEGSVYIRLNKPLNKGDQIRIECDSKDEISVPVMRLFDNNFNEVDTTDKIAVLACKSKVNIGAKVYKTKDIKFNKDVELSLNKKEYKKLPINLKFIAHKNKNIFIELNYLNYKVYAKSNTLVEEAKTSPTTKENIINQLSKLNDTPYAINNIDIDLDENVFISLKVINELRRELINKLDTERLKFKPILIKSSKTINPQPHDLVNPEITVEVSNDEQYEVAKELGIKNIYYKNVIRRNNASYIDTKDEVLVNGYGGINHYLHKNKIVSDSSLNVTNYISAGILSSIGVDRITLSQEISKDRIIKLINNYYNAYNTYPNFELIVYGRSKIMHSKYCPLKRLNMCGECKKSHYALKDDFASFPIMFNSDCTTTLLNSRTLNIMDDAITIKGINYFRLVFTTESKEETKNIINIFKNKLNKNNKESTFRNGIDTRGHFYNDPL